MALFGAVDLGPLATTRHVELSTGGAESNVAIGLARLGHRAMWHSRVGDDALGLRVVRDLRAEGVEVHATVDPDAPTGLMVKERRTSDAQRVFYHRSGSAASRLTPKDLPVGAIKQAEILHVTGITSAISASAHATVQRAIEIAKEAGTTVSFDLNHRSSLWKPSDARAAYRELLPNVDIVFAGDDEALIATDDAARVDNPGEIATTLRRLGPSTAVVKLGARGALVATANETVQLPAVPVRAVDTVGAGDAFVAGYLSAMLDGAPLAECLERGVAVGAFACTAPGDWEGLPRREDLNLLVGDNVHR
jgi:2-dehydro-3-deoxygluconokinase